MVLPLTVAQTHRLPKSASQMTQSQRWVPTFDLRALPWVSNFSLGGSALRIYTRLRIVH